MRARRSDIEGLRGVAVLSVMFFHWQVPYFGGGFVGVDIFFVISGYVITQVILRDMRNGNFSIAEFIDKRVRRIFPALFLMMFLAYPFAIWLLLPGELKSFGQSFAAMAIMSSNVFFQKTAGYFAAQADVLPLLHTWSLSIEAQYYLVVPFLIQIAYRVLSPSWQGPAFTVLALASFALSVWAVANFQSAAYYLLPSRGWEFLIGAVLAFGWPAVFGKRALREAAALAGLVMIAAAILSYSEATPFPGAAALLPCLGAALIILAGRDGGAVVSRMLSGRLMVYVGAISYSLYLWHWPIITFLRDCLFIPPAPWQTGFQIAACLLIAHLSWRYVELPFRTLQGPLVRRRLSLAATVCLVAGLLGMWASLANGWPGRVASEVLALAAYAEDYNPRRIACHTAQELPIALDRLCRYGADARPRMAAWGDSQGIELAAGIGALAEKQGQAILGIAYPGCPPVLGRGLPKDCPSHNEEILKYLERETTISTVFLVGRHSYYVNRWQSDRDDYRDRLHATVQRLAATGKTVVLIYPLPNFSKNVPAAAARSLMQGRDPESLTVSVEKYHRTNGWVVEALDSIEAPRLARIRLGDHLCAHGRCRFVAAGQPLFFDSNHLSLSGVRYLEALFQPYLSVGSNPEAHEIAAPRFQGGG
ncbi:MAG: acyltransferase [Rhodospirillales bacterium]|nr:acyltransferase [Rhodospirillales bacterium]